MVESDKVVRPVGRVRRVSGWVLLLFGALLLARMGWMVTFDRAWFGAEEWLRFWFCVWLGSLFALIGSWLLLRSRAAAWAAGVVAVGGVVLAFVYDYLLRGTAGSHPPG